MVAASRSLRNERKRFLGGSFGSWDESGCERRGNREGRGVGGGGGGGEGGSGVGTMNWFANVQVRIQAKD